MDGPLLFNGKWPPWAYEFEHLVPRFGGRAVFGKAVELSGGALLESVEVNLEVL